MQSTCTFLRLIRNRFDKFQNWLAKVDKKAQARLVILIDFISILVLQYVLLQGAIKKLISICSAGKVDPAGYMHLSR